jgi:hypothetical protein
VVGEVREAFGISERRVCRAMEQPRSSQRYALQIPSRDEPLTKRTVDLARRYGRYGDRRITALLFIVSNFLVAFGISYALMIELVHDQSQIDPLHKSMSSPVFSQTVGTDDILFIMDPK